MLGGYQIDILNRWEYNKSVKCSNFRKLWFIVTAGFYDNCLFTLWQQGYRPNELLYLKFTCHSCIGVSRGKQDFSIVFYSCHILNWDRAHIFGSPKCKHPIARENYPQVENFIDGKVHLVE